MVKVELLKLRRNWWRGRGGEDGQKLIYLRCTCEAKLIGLHVRIDLRTKGE